MERMTKRDPQGEWSISREYLAEGGTGPAAERLAALEDLWQDLEQQQEEIAVKLEALRGQGKTKTHQFNELLGKKLTNSYFLTQLQLRGLR
jgi:hypothetical protein